MPERRLSIILIMKIKSYKYTFFIFLLVAGCAAPKNSDPILKEGRLIIGDEQITPPNCNQYKLVHDDSGPNIVVKRFLGKNEPAREGFIGENKFRVISLGFPHKKELDPQRRRESALVSAQISAQYRIRDKLTGYCVGSSFRGHDLFRKRINEFFNKHDAAIKNGLIICGFHDDEENCVIIYEIMITDIKAQLDKI
jgi:hypothetical protein